MKDNKILVIDGKEVGLEQASRIWIDNKDDYSFAVKINNMTDEEFVEFAVNLDEKILRTKRSWIIEEVKREKINLLAYTNRTILRELVAHSDFATIETIDYLIAKSKRAMEMGADPSQILPNIIRNKKTTAKQLEEISKFAEQNLTIKILERDNVPRQLVLDLLVNARDETVRLHALRRVSEKELLFLILMNLTPQSKPFINIFEQVADYKLAEAHRLAKQVAEELDWQEGR
jgi:hypothetical protein